MATIKDLFGTTRSVPEAADPPGWGDELHAILTDLIDGVDDTVLEAASAAYFPVLATSSAELTAGGTVPLAAPRMRINGLSGPVTLDTSTPITAGERDGQLLELQGHDDTNTVTIANSGNVALNGMVILGDKHIIGLVWDASAAKWIERYRNR